MCCLHYSCPCSCYEMECLNILFPMHFLLSDVWCLIISAEFRYNCVLVYSVSILWICWTIRTSYLICLQRSVSEVGSLASVCEDLAPVTVIWRITFVMSRNITWMRLLLMTKHIWMRTIAMKALKKKNKTQKWTRRTFSRWLVKSFNFVFQIWNRKLKIMWLSIFISF